VRDRNDNDFVLPGIEDHYVGKPGNPSTAKPPRETPAFVRGKSLRITTNCQQRSPHAFEEASAEPLLLILVIKRRLAQFLLGFSQYAQSHDSSRPSKAARSLAEAASQSEAGVLPSS
jgi:hypothetical protein